MEIVVLIIAINWGLYFSPYRPFPWTKQAVSPICKADYSSTECKNVNKEAPSCNGIMIKMHYKYINVRMNQVLPVFIIYVLLHEYFMYTTLYIIVLTSCFLRMLVNRTQICIKRYLDIHNRIVEFNSWKMALIYEDSY